MPPDLNRQYGHDVDNDRRSLTLHDVHQAPAPTLSQNVVSRLYRRALRESALDTRQLPESVFADAIQRSVEHRFSGPAPQGNAVERYLDTLHVVDLALACACGEGDEQAWERFILTLRPALYRAGRAITGDETAGRDLADSIYAELYGVGRGGGTSNERRSLFRYYHGRSTLATWLRAILAQRHVDHVRDTRRTVVVEDRELERVARAGHEASTEPDPYRERHFAVLRVALGNALGSLAPQDRLRLGCYHTQGMTLATIGRLLGEHEATVSRRLARARREIRGALERALAEEGLTAAEIQICFEHAVEHWPFDLRAELQDTTGATFTTCSPGVRRQQSGVRGPTRG